MENVRMAVSHLIYQANAVADENQGNKKVVLGFSNVSLNDEKQANTAFCTS